MGKQEQIHDQAVRAITWYELVCCISYTLIVWAQCENVP